MIIDAIRGSLSETKGILENKRKTLISGYIKELDDNDIKNDIDFLICNFIYLYHFLDFYLDFHGNNKEGSLPKLQTHIFTSFEI